MTKSGYIYIEVHKVHLALFNHLKAEEVGCRDEGWITSEDFFEYLLH